MDFLFFFYYVRHYGNTKHFHRFSSNFTFGSVFGSVLRFWLDPDPHKTNTDLQRWWGHPLHCWPLFCVQVWPYTSRDGRTAPAGHLLQPPLTSSPLTCGLLNLSGRHLNHRRRVLLIFVDEFLLSLDTTRQRNSWQLSNLSWWQCAYTSSSHRFELSPCLHRYQHFVDFRRVCWWDFSCSLHFWARRAGLQYSYFCTTCTSMR